MQRLRALILRHFRQKLCASGFCQSPFCLWSPSNGGGARSERLSWSKPVTCCSRRHRRRCPVYLTLFLNFRADDGEAERAAFKPTVASPRDRSTAAPFTPRASPFNTIKLRFGA
ncbi:hypothetical protein SRHO_G00226220 [Serrasalmus rhombeus]